MKSKKYFFQNKKKKQKKNSSLKNLDFVKVSKKSFRSKNNKLDEIF